jgi:transcriptional regulator with XRE-family HTH domain
MAARIGRRIRAVRRSQGLTLEAVAVKANISTSLLSKLENGRVSSPIATLSNIVTALGTTVGHVLGTGDDERLVVVRAGERKRVAGRAARLGYVYESLGHTRIDKRMEPFLVTYEPGGPEAPPRAHPGESFFYVLDGRIEFRHGPGAVTLGAGDCAYFDNEIPHAARAAGRRAAVALLVTFNG